MHELLWVFGTHAGGGNAAAVVWQTGPAADADSMQQAATRISLPVSAFIAVDQEPPTVRFFTAAAELPFCGHGALAAGAALMKRTGELAARFRAGTQLVRVDRNEDLFVLSSDGAWAKPEIPDLAGLLQALGLYPERVTATRVASIGSPKALVELSAATALHALTPNPAALAAWSRANKINGAYVHTSGASGEVLARAFNPLGGTVEDAATGVAAGALVWALDHPFGEWLRVTQVPAHAARCELQARRLPPARTEVGGRVRESDSARS